MKKEELFSLRNDRLYTFNLYHGIQKHGYIHEDLQNNTYYIVKPNSENRDKSPKEIGYQVNLSQIESYEELTSTYKTTGGSFTISGNVKAKKLIILGAGASHDYNFAANNNPHSKLPLTNSLFDDIHVEILKKYSGAYDLSAEILLGKSSLEDYFQKQWQKIEKTHDQPLLNKLISSQYYMHELFYHLSEKHSNIRTNNYLNLVKLAHEYTTHNPGEFIPIVTFNYDTLLEEALQRQLQYNFHHIDGYIDYSQNKLLVFKPHGSCNWVKRFKLGYLPQTFLRQINSIDAVAKHIHTYNKSLINIHNNLESEITIYTKNANDIEQNPHLYFNHYPWLLIPYKHKDDLILPSSHKMMLQHILPNVEEILIIGWRGAESKFQNILKNSIGSKKLKITLVEPDEKTADSFCETYRNLLPNAEFKTVRQGKSDLGSFTGFIQACHSHDIHFFNS